MHQVTQRVLVNPQNGEYVHSVGYAASVNEVFDSLLASRAGTGRGAGGGGARRKQRRAASAAANHI